jgi:predicted phage terminase large subunit-like protein
MVKASLRGVQYVQHGLEEKLTKALSNPQLALQELDRLDSEESLVGFIRVLWPILEPGRQFVDGWAVRAICEHLEAVTRGQIRRLLINVPPGCMKSLTTNVFWPAWEWGPKNHPSYRYVCASYSQDLTVRDNRRCRALVASQPYRRMWGDRLSILDEQNAKVRFDTNHTGFKIATSVGGVGTGERGDRFIIDDPHNIKETESDAKREAALQWFTEVVPTRVNDAETSAIVVIMQRVHERDVSGLIIAKELGYEHLILPMEFEQERACVTSIGFKDPRKVEGQLLWPERFSKRYLEEDLKPSLRAWGGSYAEAGQLQQRPVPRGGGMFQKSNLTFVERADLPPMIKEVRGWDLAATKDAGAWTVGLKMAVSNRGQLYILDVHRLQGSPGQVERSILGCAALDGLRTRISLPQDPGQAGKAQKAALAGILHGYDFHFSLESGAKEDRAKPLAAQSEAGNLFIVKAKWTDTFVNELCLFPYGEYSDQVDAASRAYSEVIMKKARLVGLAPQSLSQSLL